jgi:hypothetical protein
MAIGLAFGVLFCMPVTLILTPVLYMVGVDIKNTPSRVARFFRWAWGSEKPRVLPAE